MTNARQRAFVAEALESKGLEEGSGKRTDVKRAVGVRLRGGVNVGPACLTPPIRITYRKSEARWKFAVMTEAMAAIASG